MAETFWTLRSACKCFFHPTLASHRRDSFFSLDAPLLGLVSPPAFMSVTLWAREARALIAGLPLLRKSLPSVRLLFVFVLPTLTSLLCAYRE